MHVTLKFYDEGAKKVNGIWVLIDDVLYQFDNLAISDGYSTATLGFIGYDMIEAIAKAKEITIRVFYGDYHADIDRTSADIKEIVAWAKAIVKSKYIDYLDEAWLAVYDSYYEASKE
ncbi:MAG: hypothetical protein IKP40_09185 [Clostridia bacterium]|nr:hypothetical protein [Clostridia bacterium]